MGDIKAAETKFATFREEMVVFKESLNEYYSFFVARCEEIIKLMQDNQLFNNKEHAELKRKVMMVSFINS